MKLGKEHMKGKGTLVQLIFLQCGDMYRTVVQIYDKYFIPTVWFQENKDIKGMTS